MTKLKGLILTEGMHGMISQAEGLAKVLDLDFIHEKIEINNFWKLIPPKFTPIKNFVFKNNIDECYDLRKKIVSEVKELFINAKTQDETTFHDGDPSGKSMITYTRFYINKDSKFEDLQIGCTDWADGLKFSDGSNATDKLTVTITTDEYFEFLKRAYK